MYYLDCANNSNSKFLPAERYGDEENGGLHGFSRIKQQRQVLAVADSRKTYNIDIVSLNTYAFTARRN